MREKEKGIIIAEMMACLLTVNNNCTLAYSDCGTPRHGVPRARRAPNGYHDTVGGVPVHNLERKLWPNERS